MNANEHSELMALARFRGDVVSAIVRLDEDLKRLRAEPGSDVSVFSELSQSDRPTEAVVDSELQSVLIRRTPGPTVTVFHSASTPCGRVARKGAAPNAFRTTWFGAAISEGLRPCTACQFEAAAEAAPCTSAGGR